MIAEMKTLIKCMFMTLWKLDLKKKELWRILNEYFAHSGEW